MFTTDRASRWDVFRVGDLPTGLSGDKNLTRGDKANITSGAPSISPDRRWVAFTSNRTGNFEIYVSAVAENDIRQITFTPQGANTGPVWSPNGRYIAFNSNRTGNWDLYVIDMLTGVTSQLTYDSFTEASPMWSPDTSTLYYEANSTGNWQVYSMFVATRAVRRISSGSGNSLNPVVSGDGNTIAFRSNQEGPNALYLMSVNGENVRRISEYASIILNQNFSADDKYLAYNSNLTGLAQVYVYELETGYTRRVTGDEGPEGTLNKVGATQPTWSCGSSEHVYFSSDAAGNFDLYVAYTGPMHARPIAVAKEAFALTNLATSDLFPQGQSSQYDAVGRTLNNR